MKYFAHTPNERKEWHFLDDHSTSVAVMTSEKCRKFNAKNLGYILGLWHDVGKTRPTFQGYLHAQYKGLPFKQTQHSIWGAALAYRIVSAQKVPTKIWADFYLPIYCHHSRLKDPAEVQSKIQMFLDEKKPDFSEIGELLKKLQMPNISVGSPKKGTRREFFIRMLFSCLIDADYLDTEAHFDIKKNEKRNFDVSLEDLWKKFQKNQTALIKKVKKEGKDKTTVNRIRDEIYNACICSADGVPGIYSLSVPTGGGKTRSGLAFALKHAIKNNLNCDSKEKFDRVIIAIPYTSIIEQTADEYRKIFGNSCVLEHHSQAIFEEREGHGDHGLKLQLATENWDAPLIVTTTVQLFESLFSNKKSSCRKLHNIANSIIILDEVQTLPPQLLAPISDVLKTLVEEYGVTIILSTATQPALENSSYLKEFQGVKVREIIPDSKCHFQKMKRVNYYFIDEPITLNRVAQEIKNKLQVLVVLNTKNDAIRLINEIGPAENVFHLSTMLCGAHRRSVLSEIRRRLKHNKPIKLISTQVVEAGVNLDFPEVWRAIGPLDRVVQAAGRCNREGGSHLGKVIIFDPSDGKTPGGSYKLGLIKALRIINQKGAEELHNPELYKEYFKELFAHVDLDKFKIQEDRMELRYPKVERNFKLIGQETVPVVVDYENAFDLLEKWRRFPSREIWRSMQPYIVNLYEWEVQKIRQSTHNLALISEGLYQWLGKYDKIIGMTEAESDPADSII